MFLTVAASLALFAGTVSWQDLPDEEIVVTAKLQRFGIHLQNAPSGKGLRCAVTRSTGDAGFDAAACLATVRCYGKKSISQVSEKKYAAVSRCVRKKMLAYERKVGRKI